MSRRSNNRSLCLLLAQLPARPVQAPGWPWRDLYDQNPRPYRQIPRAPPESVADTVPETRNRQFPTVQPVAGYEIERRIVTPSGVATTTHISGRLLVQTHLVAEQPRMSSEQESAEHHMTIAAEPKAQDVILVAHYCCDPVIQALIEETGGCVSDSLEMVRFGNQHPAQMVVAAGMRFMGEMVRILSPEKHVLTPTLEAVHSLDLGCPVDEFSAFCGQHPERTMVVYADTFATVEAYADWIVASSCAVEVAKHPMDNGEPILWAPDQHLGYYIQRKAGADMLLWNNACVIHEGSKVKWLGNMKALYPDATILIHPGSPESVVTPADAVGSTSQLIKVAQTPPNKTFVVVTDRSIFYKMQQLCSGRDFTRAPTAGNGTVYCSYMYCPWMAMNTLKRTLACLYKGSEEIFVGPALVPRVVRPLRHMFNSTRAARLRQTGNA